MKKTASIFLFMALTLSGCATTPHVHINNPNEVSKNFLIERDDLKKVTFMRGPRFSTYSDVNQDNAIDQIAIDATLVDEPDTIMYWIFVNDIFSGHWRNYSVAHDSEGQEFQVLKTGSSVWWSSGDTFEEFLDIPVTRGYLERHRYSGITMKISGSGGKAGFSIPPGYIAGVLRAVPKR